MANSQHYDAVVVGAGQGGGPLASALARAGRRTALIEREHIGGTCINTGCTPTKTMVASARAAYLARRAADYGVESGPVRVDMAAVRRRKRAVVASFRSGSERRIEETPGLDLIRGEARFTGPKALCVDVPDGRLDVTAEQIFLDVGTRPAPPPLPGIDRVAALDSTSIMELDTVPEHLLVLGGGYVGLEFSQMFRRFGSRVTVVQRGSACWGGRTTMWRMPSPASCARTASTVLLATEARARRTGIGGRHRPHGQGREWGARAHRLAPADGGWTSREHRSPRAREDRRRDKREGVHSGRRAAGDECPGHLRAGRRHRRSRLHPYLLRRLPHPAHQSHRRRGCDDQRSPRPLYGLYRSPARPCRSD